MQALFDAGADINAVDNKNSTALILASSRRQDAVVRFLLDHGADVNTRSEDLGSAIEAARLARDGDMSPPSSPRGSPVDNENVIAMLLEAGVRDYKQTAGWIDPSPSADVLHTD
jgi:ankyrin repeat protein